MCVPLLSPRYCHHSAVTTLLSPLYYHHFTVTTLLSPLYYHHVTVTTLLSPINFHTTLPITTHYDTLTLFFLSSSVITLLPLPPLLRTRGQSRSFPIICSLHGESRSCRRFVLLITNHPICLPIVIDSIHSCRLDRLDRSTKGGEFLHSYKHDSYHVHVLSTVFATIYVTVFIDVELGKISRKCGDRDNCVGHLV